jgi:hypothetical protein
MANGKPTSTTRGYLEWERIKRLPQDPRCIAEAEGKVVKVISRLLLSLPAEHVYRIIFMQRPLPEVMASQDEMLRHRGTFKPGADSTFISAAFERPARGRCLARRPARNKRDHHLLPPCFERAA